MKKLPVLNGHVAESSLQTDGTRKRVVPADVSGRFTSARRVAFAVLVLFWAALPWVRLGGAPALFIDVGRRRFFVFGATFNAQDLWLTFFLLTGLGFGLAFLTTLVGRVWCGWACPQTVFLEGLFRPIERLVNGSREKQLRRERSGAALDRAVRLVVTHALYIVASLLVAHVFVAYFVSIPALFAMVREAPAEHPEVFAWMLALTGLFYGNFAFFREQTCVVVCPYGRLQSALLDDDSLVIGYDEARGEPRGKVQRESASKEPARGDCVDCRRCVVVCPTGIDIRNGLQMDCIGCAACIDACDDIMTKLGRPKGLVRYDSPRGLRGERRRVIRPRVVLASALLVVGAVVAAFAMRARTPYEANLVRLAGAPFVREGGEVRNAFEVHLVNKASETTTFLIEPDASAGERFVIPMGRVELASLEDRRVPVFVSVAAPSSTGAASGAAPPRVKLRVRREGEAEARVLDAAFLGIAR